MMRHFAHNIGDYAAATAHLSFVEDAAYHRMLRRYYQQEKPLPNDVVLICRLIAARSKEERQAVDLVLTEFFTLEDDGWHQKRADRELEIYRNKTEAARLNGTKGGRPANPKITNPVSDGVPTEKLSTPHSPLPSSDPYGSDASVEPDLLKAAFDSGLKVLMKSGVSEHQARGLIGKWRKEYGEEAVLVALGKCQQASVTEPVSWITAALRAPKTDNPDGPKVLKFNG